MRHPAVTRPVMLALSILCAAGVARAQDDYSTWAYRKSIWLDTKASGANVSNPVANFPVLIRLNPSNFDGFANTLPAGADIRFASSSGTHLRYQIERWVDVAGNLDTAEIWVLAPAINGNDSLGNQILMYWNKAGAADSSSSSSVFSPANAFMDVLHLGEAPNDGGTFSDATGLGYTATANNFQNATDGTGTTNAAGAIGRGVRLDSTDDYVRGGNVQPPNDMTASAWVYLGKQVSGGEMVVMGRKDESGGHQWDAFQMYFQWGSLRPIFYWVNTNDSSTSYEASTGISVGAWHYLVGQRAGSSLRFYIDGQLNTGGPSAGPAPTGTMAAPIWGLPIGAENGASRHFNKALLDEIRIDSVARSADWIKLCYQNQQPTQTLAVYGASQTNTGKTWNGSVSSSWNTAGNWTPSGVPGSADFAVFPSGPVRLCTLDVDINVVSLQIQGCGLNTSSSNHAITCGSLSMTGGSLTANASAIAVQGNWNVSGGSFVCNTSTVILNGASGTQQVTTGGASFNNLTLNNNGSTTQLMSALSANGNLTRLGGAINLNGNNVTVTGNLTINSGTTTTFATNALNGRKITVGGYASLSGQSGNLLNIVAGASTVCTLAVTGTLTANYATITNNRAQTSAGTAYGSTNGGGNTNWTFSGSGVTRFWVGGSGNWSDAANHWAAISGGVAGSGNLPTNTDATSADGNSGVPTITVDQSVSVASFSSWPGNNVINLNGHSFRCSGNWTMYSGSALGGTDTLHCGSFIDNNGSFNFQTAALERIGAGGEIRCNAGTRFSDVVLNATGAYNFYVDAANGRINIARTLHINAGTVTIGNGDADTLSVAGNLSITGGTLSLANNTVRAGSLTVTSGTTTTFTGLGGATLTVTGAASLSGQSGNLLDLNPGTTWFINAGTLTADYATLMNSNASGGATGVASVNCANGGNNTNWNFGVSAPRVWTGSAGDNLWATFGNWTGSAVPGSGDTAIFNSTAIACNLTATVSVKCIVFTSGYSGAFGFAGHQMTVLQNADFRSGGSFVGGGTLLLSGATQTLYPGAGMDLGRLKLGTGTVVTVSGLGFTADTLDIDTGSLSLGAGLVDSARQALVTGPQGSLDFGSSTLRVSAGTVNLNNMGTVTPGSGTLEFSGSAAQTFTPKAGVTYPSIVQSGAGGTSLLMNPLHAAGFSQSAGSFNWGSVTPDTVVSLTMSGGSMQFGNSTIHVLSGNANFGGATSITPTTGTLVFDGASGTQVLTPRNGQWLPNIVKNGAGTVQVSAQKLWAGALTIAGGTWDWNSTGPDTVASIATAGSGATMLFGSSTVGVDGGDCDLSGLGTLNAGTGTLVFSLAAQVQNLKPLSGSTHPSIVQAGSGGTTVSGSDLTSVGGLSISGGTFGLGGRTCTFTSVSTSGGGLDLGTGGSLVSTGGVDLGGLNSTFAGTQGRIQFSGAASRTFRPVNSAFLPVLEVDLLAGMGSAVVTLTDSLRAGYLQVQSGTLSLGKGVQVDSLNVAGALTFGTSTVQVTGNATFGGSATAGSGTLALTGSTGSTQVVTPPASGSLPAIVHATASTMQLATRDLSCTSVNQTNGAFNFNGRNVTTSSDFNVSNGTPTTLAGLAGRTVSVGGKARLYGTSGNLLDLNTASDHYWAVTDSLVGRYATITHSRATNHYGFGDVGCVNGGSNYQWVFGGKPGPLSYHVNPAVYTRTQAITPDTVNNGGGAADSFTVSPALSAGLAIDRPSGRISGTPSAAQATTVYKVKAWNLAGADSVNLTIRVNPLPPVINYARSTMVCTSGVAVAANAVSNTGDAADSFSVLPALPAGLSLNHGSGLLSGTPTVAWADTQAYTVTAFNGWGTQTGQATVKILVKRSPPGALTYVTSSLVCTSGVAIRADSIHVVGGGAIDSFTVSPALPAGLNLDQTSGAVWGTPSDSTVATAGYTVWAWNQSGKSSVVLTVQVKRAPPGPLHYATSQAIYVRNTPIAPNALTNPGGRVAKYAVAPALPTGLVLDTITGTISGTPTVTSVQTVYTVSGTNESGLATTLDTIRVDLNVTAPVISYSPAVVVDTIGIAAAHSMSNTGSGADSVTITPDSTTLTAVGLHFNRQNGLVSGTPSATLAPTAFTVRAYNEAGNASTTLTLSVVRKKPGPLVYTPDSATYTVGMAADTGLFVLTNGGGAIGKFSISPALPAGLVLDTVRGSIRGTPTAVAASWVWYVVTASNAAGSATDSLQLRVRPAAVGPLAYRMSHMACTVGVAIHADTLVNAGGAADSFTVTPTLPRGLAFNKASGLVSGTPDTSTDTLFYTVTGRNETGLAQALCTLWVKLLPPGPIAYAASPVMYVVGQAIVADTVVHNGGGPVDSFRVLSTLPAGLAMTKATGRLSGTPTTPTPADQYIVEARNASGVAYDTLTITVVDTGAIVNPLGLHVSFVDTQHVQLHISGYSHVSSAPDPYNPYADSAGVWYMTGRFPTRADTGSASRMKVSFVQLKAKAEPYDTVIAVPKITAGQTMYYFGASLFWHHPDSLPELVHGDSVYMRDTASPVNPCSLTVTYAGHASDTVLVLVRNIGAIDTLRAASLVVSFSQSDSLFSPILRDTIPLATVRSQTQNGVFSFVATNPVFGGARDTLWCGVELQGFNSSLSRPVEASVVVGHGVTPNPLTLQAQTLDYQRIALHWNDISASGATQVRVVYDTVALPLNAVNVSTPFPIQQFPVRTSSDTVLGLQPQTVYHFAVQAFIDSLWTPISAAASAVDSTMPIDTARMVANSIVISSVRYDTLSHRIAVTWHFSYRSDVQYGYVVSTDSLTGAVATPSPDSWVTPSDSVMITYIDLGANILFDTTYYVFMRLQKVGGDPSLLSAKSIVSVKTGPYNWQPIQYFRTQIGDTVRAFNNHVAIWYAGTWPWGNVGVDTLEVFHPIPAPPGFIVVSLGFSAEVSQYFVNPLTLAIRYDSVPAGYHASDIRLYHQTASGLWMVFHGSGLVGTDSLVAATTRWLPGESYILMIDTVAPQITPLCALDSVLTPNRALSDSVRISDNCANVVATYLFSRGDQAPVRLPADTFNMLVDTARAMVLGSYVASESGLRLYLVVSDGLHVDTLNLSRRVRRVAASDISAEAQHWVPLRTTADLDHPAMDSVVYNFLDGAAYNPQRIRLFRWDGPAAAPGALNKWIEYAAARESLFTLIPGRLMWVKTNQSKLLDFGDGVTTSLRDTVGLALAAHDWTDFALPYAFPMKVGDVLDASGALSDSLQFYVWTWGADSVFTTAPLYIKSIPDSSLNDRTDSMRAGALDAFSVFNPLDSVVKLRIPPICAAMSTVTNAAHKSLASDGSWVLRVSTNASAKTQGATLLCGFAPSLSATTSLYPLGPSFAQAGVRISDNGHAWGNAIRHRADHYGGHAFELSFFNTTDKPQCVRASVSGLGKLNDSLRAIVVDPVGGGMVSAVEAISVTVPAKATVTRILTVGGPGYARVWLHNVKPFAQFAAFPNPFRGVLTVQFMMPDGVARVECRLFDLQGRELWAYDQHNIQSGVLNRVVWDGRNSLQHNAATGYYILQLRAIDNDNHNIQSLNQRLLLLR